MTLYTIALLELSERRHQLTTSLLAVTLGIAAIVSVQTIAMRSAIEVAHQVDALGANIMILPKSATIDDYYKADLSTDQFTIPEAYVDKILFAKDEAGLEGVDNLSPKLSVPMEIEGRKFTLTGILPKNEFMAKAAWSGGVFDTPTACASDRKSIVEFNVAERLRRKPIDTLAPDQCLVGAELGEMMKLSKGSKTTMLGKAFTVIEVLPKTGTLMTDVSLLISIRSKSCLKKVVSSMPSRLLDAAMRSQADSSINSTSYFRMQRWSPFLKSLPRNGRPIN
jgi:putative ABC transport system permease protein